MMICGDMILDHLSHSFALPSPASLSNLSVIAGLGLREFLVHSHGGNGMAQLKALIHRGSLGIPGFIPWAKSPLPDASLAGGLIGLTHSFFRIR